MRRQRSRVLVAAPLVAAPLAAGAFALIYAADPGATPVASTSVPPVAPGSPVPGLTGGGLGQPLSDAGPAAASGTAAAPSSLGLEIVALRTAPAPVAPVAPAARPAVGASSRTAAPPTAAPRPAAPRPVATTGHPAVTPVVPGPVLPSPVLANPVLQSPVLPSPVPPSPVLPDPLPRPAVASTAQGVVPTVPAPPAADRPAPVATATRPPVAPPAAAKGRHRLPQGLHRAQGRHQG